MTNAWSWRVTHGPIFLGFFSFCWIGLEGLIIAWKSEENPTTWPAWRNQVKVQQMDRSELAGQWANNELYGPTSAAFLSLNPKLGGRTWIVIFYSRSKFVSADLVHVSYPQAKLGVWPGRRHCIRLLLMNLYLVIERLKGTQMDGGLMDGRNSQHSKDRVIPLALTRRRRSPELRRLLAIGRPNVCLVDSLMLMLLPFPISGHRPLLIAIEADVDDVKGVAICPLELSQIKCF